MKKKGIKPEIRYSESFKLKVVKEIEGGLENPFSVSRKYGIRGAETVRRWLGHYGSGKHGKVIRVQNIDEQDELKRLKKELQRTKEALADAHIDLALEKAFNDLLAKKAGIEDRESFRKKHFGR